jgi:hypothetical protein
VPWSFTNVLIQNRCRNSWRACCRHCAKEHSFGAFGHTIAGAGGGGLSGLLLQTLAATVVTETGSLNELRLVEQFVLQAFTGAVVGGIATLIGLIRDNSPRNRSTRTNLIECHGDD